jgi:hypothetical protein
MRTPTHQKHPAQRPPPPQDPGRKNARADRKAERKNEPAEPAVRRNADGYRSFQLGGFHFSRDAYFAHIGWPKGHHQLPVDAFLRALMRDVGWGFFYGTVNFDDVFGTVNHYGHVDVFAGRYNPAFRDAGRDLTENFPAPQAMAVFKEMLLDWTNEGFDPYAAPAETGSAFGIKHGENRHALDRHREVASRMVGLDGDLPLRADANGHPINRGFADVPQDAPEVKPEPGFEGQLCSINFFAYLSRSDVTWNPSVASVVKDSQLCATSEEYVLPIAHGNDRVEWFLQLSDEISWDVSDKLTGKRRARVTMRPGDVAAMPADIRHQGYSPKRSMLMVWENNWSELPALVEAGKAPIVPVKF